MTCTIDRERIERTISFHGHWCPGLAIGIRAAEWALTELGGRAEDEELVAMVETDMCGVDAIQFLTGCTFGKGNLIHRDFGKNVFTFYRRSDGKSARLVLRAMGSAADREEMAALHEKRQAGTLTSAEENRLSDLREKTSAWLMQASLDKLFDVRPAAAPLPEKARILESATCDRCGEQVMRTRIRQWEGKNLCIPCYEQGGEVTP
ncbi:MAG: FmdE family protein [Desulfobacterales bacterium]